MGLLEWHAKSLARLLVKLLIMRLLRILASVVCCPLLNRYDYYSFIAHWSSRILLSSVLRLSRSFT